MSSDLKRKNWEYLAESSNPQETQKGRNLMVYLTKT
jgi:hypothetical protein